MPDSISVSTTLSVSAKRLYEAWLNSEEHTAFTGDEAEVDPAKGGKFTAWGGYIKGTNLELHPFKKIVQAWRTTEFLESDPDSRLVISFEEMNGKTRITLKHTKIPKGQGQNYKKGWKDYYFKPMKEYFENS